MTRDEAKEMLRVVKALLPIRPYTDIAAEALDMAIEALERKQGKWIEYKCSICGFEPYNPSGLETFNYCSNCGAKMDEREEEDDIH